MLRLVLIVALLSAPGAPSAHAAPAVLPAVAMQRLDGTRADTDEWLGRPLVLNIWATWCAPCRKEMPSLQRLADTLAPADDIGVAALSIDEDANLVREFVLKYGIDFPLGIAVSPGQAMSALGVRALPLTLYVSADGRIIERVVGERAWGDQIVAQEIRAKLLPDRTGR